MLFNSPISLIVCILRIMQRIKMHNQSDVTYEHIQLIPLSHCSSTIKAISSIQIQKSFVI